MNRDEAKTILLLYRPGTADSGDPQIAEALALTKQDPELSRWLEEYSARQELLRAKLRQISIPAGLKEQIVSERMALLQSKIRREKMVGVVAAVAIVVSLLVLVQFWQPRRPAADDTLAGYEKQMVSVALRGYGMDLTTTNLAQIRTHLAENNAPADYVLPAGLQKAALLGCAVEGWQNTKVSLICFRTGRPLPPNQQADLWLFVVDRAAVKDAPEPDQPKITAVNQLTTAVWTQGDKVYFLGTTGDQEILRQYL
ncbi:MAG TPA: hypothetical protein VFY06_08670 [Verrucomicrobiae bacterium]|nr:hypothetical protein [Verrucomicrobiae bacterium]